MLIAFVESRPRLSGPGWEDCLLGRQEMAFPPQYGSVVRIPTDGGEFRRFRVREVVYDLPGSAEGEGEGVAEREASVYVVLIAHMAAPIIPTPGILTQTRLFMED